MTCFYKIIKHFSSFIRSSAVQENKPQAYRTGEHGIVRWSAGLISGCYWTSLATIIQCVWYRDQWWNNTDSRGRTYSERNFTSTSTPSAINPACTVLGLNPGFADRRVTNRQSHDLSTLNVQIHPRCSVGTYSERNLTSASTPSAINTACTVLGLSLGFADRQVTNRQSHGLSTLNVQIHPRCSVRTYSERNLTSASTPSAINPACTVLGLNPGFADWQVTNRQSHGMSTLNVQIYPRWSVPLVIHLLQASRHRTLIRTFKDRVHLKRLRIG